MRTSVFRGPFPVPEAANTALDNRVEQAGDRRWAMAAITYRLLPKQQRGRDRSGLERCAEAELQHARRVRLIDVLLRLAEPGVALVVRPEVEVRPIE